MGHPDAPGRQRRLEWAVLLKRAYAIDVLRCPRCAGPMRFIAVIENEIVARKILLHLGRGRPRRSGVQVQLSLDDPDRFDGIDATYPS